MPEKEETVRERQHRNKLEGKKGGTREGNEQGAIRVEKERQEIGN